MYLSLSYWKQSLLVHIKDYYCSPFSQHLGDSTKTLQDIASGKHPFSKELASAKNPMVIVGSGALQRPDADALHSAVISIANSVSKPDSKDWRTLNVLQRVGHD